MLQVRLLGQPSVSQAGERQDSLSAPRAIALLALLILEAKPQVSRAHLGAALWPQHAEADRQNNLRVALHRLRVAWPRSSQALEIGRYAVCWREPSLVQADVDALCEILERPATLAGLQQVRELLGGVLLEGYDARWIQAHRRHLQQRLRAWLERVVRQLESLRLPAAVMAGLRAASSTPPLDAQGWQQLLALVAQATPGAPPRRDASSPALDLGRLGAADRALVFEALEAQAERLLAEGRRGEARRSRELADRLAQPAFTAACAPT